MTNFNQGLNSVCLKKRMSGVTLLSGEFIALSDLEQQIKQKEQMEEQNACFLDLKDIVQVCLSNGTHERRQESSLFILPYLSGAKKLILSLNEYFNRQRQPISPLLEKLTHFNKLENLELDINLTSYCIGDDYQLFKCLSISFSCLKVLKINILHVTPLVNDLFRRLNSEMRVLSVSIGFKEPTNFSFEQFRHFRCLEELKLSLNNSIVQSLQSINPIIRKLRVFKLSISYILTYNDNRDQNIYEDFAKAITQAENLVSLHMSTNYTQFHQAGNTILYRILSKIHTFPATLQKLHIAEIKYKENIKVLQEDGIPLLNGQINEKSEMILAISDKSDPKSDKSDPISESEQEKKIKGGSLKQNYIHQCDTFLVSLKQVMAQLRVFKLNTRGIFYHTCEISNSLKLPTTNEAYLLLCQQFLPRLSIALEGSSNLEYIDIRCSGALIATEQNLTIFLKSLARPRLKSLILDMERWRNSYRILTEDQDKSLIKILIYALKDNCKESLFSLKVNFDGWNIFDGSFDLLRNTLIDFPYLNELILLGPKNRLLKKNIKICYLEDFIFTRKKYLLLFRIMKKLLGFIFRKDILLEVFALFIRISHANKQFVKPQDVFACDIMTATQSLQADRYFNQEQRTYHWDS